MNERVSPHSQHRRWQVFQRSASWLCLRWVFVLFAVLLHAVSPIAEAMGGVADAPFAAQTIHYRLGGAGEVFLVWGVDGWNPVPEAQRPHGTIVRDRVMYTPMLHEGDVFTVMLHVPAGATVDYAFQITKTRDGASIEIWDANGDPKQDYHTIAHSGGVVEIRGALELPHQSAGGLAHARSWRPFGLLVLGFVVVFGGSVWALRRNVFASQAPAWRYPSSDDGRDLRIDFLRGLAICNVVIDHIRLPSVYQILASERIGAVTEAEAFVFLSGVVLGMVYRKRVERQGWAVARQKLLRRARELYGAALFVIMSVYAISFVPLIDSRVITTFSDEKTGTTYSLYGNGSGFGQFIGDVLLLRYGPSQINIVGLFVILTACTSIALWLLQNNRTVLLLGLSWGMYAFYALHPFKILFSAFEYPFPLFAWQVLFVHGLVAGYYRHELLAFVRGRLGIWVLASAIALAATGMLFALNNPWVKVPSYTRLSFIPDGTFTEVYRRLFQRVDLGVGRAINAIAALIVGYALLSRWWTPLNRLIGWLFVPLGQASLYVFIVHVYFVLIVDNISMFHQGNLLINTLGHTTVVLAIWVMVRKRFLFRWVPQ